MNTKLKAMLSLLAISSTAITSTIFAEEVSSKKDTFADVDTSEIHTFAEVETSESDMPEEQKDSATDCDINYAVPPAQYPAGAESKNYFLSAAYTYWVPYQEGLNIAIGSNDIETPGDIARPAMNGASGFKIGAGINLQHDGWIASAEYTWFYYAPNFKANTLIDGPEYNAIFNNNSVTYTTLQSQFAMQFNRVDLTVDRSFCIGDFITLKPWMGLLFACDRQHLNYIGAIASVENNESEYAFRQEDWYGIGPYAGSEAMYYFGKDWGLYISSGMSMLLAHRYVSVNDTNVITATGALSSIANYNKTSFDGVNPMLEIGLGARWDGNWTNWGLCIDLGWELQTYFNHNGFLPYNSPTGLLGDFSMQGLTLAIKVTF